MQSTTSHQSEVAMVSNVKKVGKHFLIILEMDEWGSPAGGYRLFTAPLIMREPFLWSFHHYVNTGRYQHHLLLGCGWQGAARFNHSA